MEILKYILFLFFAISCASKENYLQDKVNSGDISISQNAENINIYEVKVIGKKTINWDGTDHKERIQSIEFLLKDKCSDIILLDEKSTPRGSIGFNNIQTWHMRVKCVN